MAEAEAVGGEQSAPAFGRRRDVMIVLPGLLLALILAMLDQLVVSTALPRIVGDLGGLNHLSWVVTAYVLASTITTPLYGKLGDLYGRKRLLVAAILIFLAGSALSGLSHTMDQLIIFRALQGLGAGGLMVGALATIGDLVSPRERGQYMGYMMAAMMIAMIAGPLVGGYITDALSWRWIFYINMPIGAIALAYIFATLHLPKLKIQHRIDYLGAAILAVGATAIVLVTTWGGSSVRVGLADDHDADRGGDRVRGRVHLGREQGGRADPADARVQEPQLLAGQQHELPARHGDVRRDDVPAAVPADRAARVPDRERSAADPDDAGLDRDLADRWPGHRADRQVQGAADHRRSDHDRRHAAAVDHRRQHLPVDIDGVLRRTRRRHGLPDAGHDADRAEQRRPEGHGRGEQLAGVLPADRRLDRGLDLRRAVQPGR